MDIEILEMAERMAKFILKNSSPAMANALRRTLLSDIPKMAIDKVEFHLGPIMYDDKEYESVTPLYYEIKAHRLGMVPVPTDLDLFVPQSECSCGGEGCPNCTIMYSLNKIGPCTVLSGDLEPLGNPDLRVKDEFIPIVELTDGQAVLIYATAVMGTARKHVKWQVANGVGYKYMPGVEVDPARAGDDDVVECAALCPKKVFEVEDGKLVAYYDAQKIRRDVDFTDFADETSAEDWYWATEQDYVSGALGVPADVAAAFIAAARERFHLVFCRRGVHRRRPRALSPRFLRGRRRRSGARSRAQRPPTRHPLTFFSEGKK